MTVRRTLDTIFTDPTDLPVYIPNLPIAGALRRYSAMSAGEAAGSPVSALPNLGSASGALAASGGAPTMRLTERPYLEFDGTNDLMVAPTDAAVIPTGSPVTVYAVARLRELPPSGQQWPVAAYVPSGGLAFSVGPTGVTATYRAGATPAGLTVGTVAAGTWRVFLASWAPGGTHRARFDSTKASASQTGGNAAGALKIGESVAGTPTVKIDIAEIGTFASALSDSDADTLVAFLRDLYTL